MRSYIFILFLRVNIFWPPIILYLSLSSKSPECFLLFLLYLPFSIPFFSKLPFYSPHLVSNSLQHSVLLISLYGLKSFHIIQCLSCFTPFSFSPKMFSHNSSSFAARLQPMFEPNSRISAKQDAPKRNMAVSFADDTDGTTLEVDSGNFFWPHEDTDSGIQRPLHNPFSLATRPQL